jgi:hypothetical protein
MIWTYVKQKNKVVGVLAATKVNNDVFCGFSKVNRSAGDVFNKDLGVQIALDRSRKGSLQPVPHSMRHDYVEFICRAKRYFKDAIVHD